jgi:hypothetical protein
VHEFTSILPPTVPTGERGTRVWLGRERMTYPRRQYLLIGIFLEPCGLAGGSSAVAAGSANNAKANTIAARISLVMSRYLYLCGYNGRRLPGFEILLHANGNE